MPAHYFSLDNLSRKSLEKTISFNYKRPILANRDRSFMHTDNDIQLALLTSIYACAHNPMESGAPHRTPFEASRYHLEDVRASALAAGISHNRLSENMEKVLSSVTEEMTWREFEDLTGNVKKRSDDDHKQDRSGFSR